jgi:hypothetical protein
VEVTAYRFAQTTLALGADPRRGWGVASLEPSVPEKSDINHGWRKQAPILVSSAPARFVSRAKVCHAR